MRVCVLTFRDNGQQGEKLLGTIVSNKEKIIEIQQKAVTVVLPPLPLSTDIGPWSQVDK